MSIWQAFRLAGKSIVGSRLRSFLTMLGMIIGVASVIALTGLMTGVNHYIVNTFSDLGTNIISVSVMGTDTRKVSVDSMYQLADDNPDLFQAVSPTVAMQNTVKNGTDSLDTTVTGVGEDYMDIKSLKLSAGRAIQYGDIKARSRVCVVGTYIVQELFNGKITAEDTIKINGQVFTIVGIQEEQEDSKVNSADDCIFIPYTTASRMAYNSDITSYAFAAVDTDHVEQGETILDAALYSVLKNEDLYRITSMTMLLDMVDSMTGMLGSILGGIAGISLLVAGIGIMNIMLVSVVERTREIGVRKSLGAKRRDIMRQFVIEAAVISTIGGLIGIVLGTVATVMLGNAFGIEAYPTNQAVLMAFGVSVAIGVCFGYMPAGKAAKLNPIDALRSE